MVLIMYIIKLIMYTQGIISAPDSLAGKTRMLIIYPNLRCSTLPWYPNADLKFVLYVHVDIKIIPCKFHVLNPKYF